MHQIIFQKDVDNFEVEHKTCLELFGVGGAVPSFGTTYNIKRLGLL